MKCPECLTDITDGSRVHVACGWGTTKKDARGGAQRRKSEFDSLKPCYRCAGTGIDVGPKVKIEQAPWMARTRKGTPGPFPNPEDPDSPFNVPNPYESQGVVSCPCSRGQWMSEYGELFQAAMARTGA